MRFFAWFTALCVLAFLVGSSIAFAYPVRRGITTGYSEVSRLSACGIAKKKANKMHCPRGAIEKKVSECSCTLDGEGWSCSVGFGAVCREKNVGKSSYTWTTTIEGTSTWSRDSACNNATIESRQVRCPGNTLQRELGDCSCEVRGGAYTCLRDQTLWCH